MPCRLSSTSDPSPGAAVRDDGPPTVRPRTGAHKPAGRRTVDVAGGGPCPSITTPPGRTSPSRKREGPHHEQAPSDSVTSERLLQAPDSTAGHTLSIVAG